jgi:hypothetical protein
MTSHRLVLLRIGLDAADFLGGALAHAEDVVDVAGFERAKGGGADHAAVGVSRPCAVAAPSKIC